MDEKNKSDKPKEGDVSEKPLPEIKISKKTLPKKKILVVEDNPRIRRIITFYLSRSQFETTEAENGEFALMLLQKQKFDLILLDIMLPDIDGFTLCSKIKSDILTKSTPVIFLTAKGEKEDVVRALKSGADDYVVKPFRKETLLTKIRKFFPEDTLIIEQPQ